MEEIPARRTRTDAANRRKIDSSFVKDWVSVLIQVGGSSGIRHERHLSRKVQVQRRRHIGILDVRGNVPDIGPIFHVPEV